METGFFVVQRKKCEACDGAGLVYSSEWKEYAEHLKEWQAKHIHLMNAEGLTEARKLEEQNFWDWWAERGYGMDEIPPEEHECYECEGRGVVEQEVNLNIALERLSVARAV